MATSETAHSSSRQPLRRGGVGTGFRLAGASWATLRSDPELLWAPTVALVASAAAIALDVVAWGGFREAFDGPTLIVVLKLWPLLVVLHLVGVLADAVVVGAARIRLAGGDPELHQGWAIAVRRLPVLIAYALLRAMERTLTLALSAFRQPGRWLGDLIDAVWDFATFLAVPVILFERPAGPFAAVRRSAHLVRSRWGTQLVAQATIGLAVFLVVVPVGVAVAVLCWAAFGAASAWIAAGATFAVLEVVSAALSAALSAAMYRFLHTGHTSPGFAEDDLLSAFTARTHVGRPPAHVSPEPADAGPHRWNPFDYVPPEERFLTRWRRRLSGRP